MLCHPLEKLKVNTNLPPKEEGVKNEIITLLTKRNEMINKISQKSDMNESVELIRKDMNDIYYDVTSLKNTAEEIIKELDEKCCSFSERIEKLEEQHNEETKKLKMEIEKIKFSLAEPKTETTNIRTSSPSTSRRPSMSVTTNINKKTNLK